MLKYLLYILIISGIIFNSATTMAQPKNVTIKGKNIDLADVDLLQDYADNNPLSLVYLQLSGDPDTSLLSKHGIYLQQYITNNTWQALLDHCVFNKDMNVLYWAVPSISDKINSYILSNYSLTSDKPISLLVSFPKRIDENTIVAFLKEHNATIEGLQEWKSANTWRIKLAANKIEVLAGSPLVSYINQYVEDQLMNDRAIGISNTSIAQQTISIGGYNLHGEGVTVGVGDDANPQTHIDFNGRINFFNPYVGSYHGFHTAGTVAGGGNRDERYKGFAPKAGIISQLFSGVFAYAPSLYATQNMRITNNSYGNILSDCDYAGTYDFYSNFLDAQIRQYPDLLHVFASGNDGLYICDPYATGFHTTAGSYQASKNVLVVGNAQNSYDAIMRPSSSRGPVKDGRIKPEIVALGFLVNSCIPNNLYAKSSGTSMACPNVSGASALLYQLYKNLHGGLNPDAALIKLLLMNGATDIMNAGPDYISGFGLMNIGHSLKGLSNNQYFSGIINTNQTQTYSFSIPANVAKAKVMLYWDDPEAIEEATQTLINDLDIKVINTSGSNILPLVLNPAADQVDAPAVNGADHTNNVEQVTLINPTAGNYTISVSGFNVPIGNQKYYVGYDFVQEGIAIQYPFGGEMIRSGDSTAIYWEASDDNTNTFTVSYSSDNGSSWNIISNNVAPTMRNITWQIPSSIASSTCRIKVVRNNTSQEAVSGAFTTMAMPTVTLSPVEEQCPGSVKLTWTAISNATGYKVYLLEGSEMVEKDNVPASSTSYTFSGLDMNTVQWVSVAPVLNNKRGLRAVSQSRTPNTGNCDGTNTGDLALTQIINPTSGRQFTSSAIPASELITARIYNLSGIVADNYRVSYRINNGSWQSQNFTTNIAPTGFADITLNTVPMSIAAPGTYNVSVVVTNLSQTDVVHQNDTFSTVIKNIANPALDITDGYVENFENTSNVESMGILFGIDGAQAWDFTASKPKGRVRSLVTNTVTIDGNRSLSLDNNYVQQGAAISQSSFNTLTGTYNLSNYTLASGEMRCEMDYRLHGIPKFSDTGNRVWIRGSDTSQWVLAHIINTNDIGTIHHTGSISINDFLNANGQQLSSSTQIKVEQYDTSLICGEDYGNGLTVDNFKLYFVTNDVQLLSINDIHPLNCTLSEATPLSIKVRNGVLYDLSDIPVFYQLDGGAIVNDTIPFIASKDTVDFTFSQLLDLSSFGEHTLSVWTYLDVDSYHDNDSILNYKLYNQPTIITYPFLQDFESNNGNFYTSSDSVWQYGAPQSDAIHYAASGNKAWKTILNGFYKPNTTAYLYSPCFDISGLSKPTLSFSLSFNIEPRGDQLFDNGFVEYSNDGVLWKKLGAITTGTNWYNDSANVWQGDQSYWHVATSALPPSDIIMLRFVLKSDPGSELDGMAIDDVHIYDLQTPIYNEAHASIDNKDVAQNTTISFIYNGNIMASINNSGSSLGNTEVVDYPHTDYVNTDSLQYYLPRNFTIKPTTINNTNATVNLYVLDSDMDKLRNDNTCPSCSPSKEAYRLGVTTYSNENKNIENDLLTDNDGGIYRYIPYRDVKWVPYDKGYYASFKVNSFSEFWFNDGGVAANAPLNEKTLLFNASHYGSRYAKIDWQSFADQAISQYDVERSSDNQNFETVASIPSLQQPNQQNYTYIDTPFVNSPIVYYRLHYRSSNDDDRWFYSPVRMLDWQNSPSVNVYPNPISNGVLFIDWIKGNDQPLKWAVFNIAGQQLATGTIADNTYNGKAAISLQEWGISSGVLIMKVICGNDKWDFKLVYNP